MMPNPPVWPKHFGERAAVIEMFFTRASEQALERESFLTGASTTGVRVLPTRPGIWSLITTGHFADAAKRDVLKRWLPALRSRKRRERCLRKQPDKNPLCSTLPAER